MRHFDASPPQGHLVDGVPREPKGRRRSLGLRNPNAIARDHDLEHGDQRPRTRLGLDASRHDRLTSVRDHDDITGLEVRRRVLEEAEVVAGCVVETVDGHAVPSIDSWRRANTPASPQHFVD